MSQTYEKRGYLNEDFHLFYNADLNPRSVPFHFHDFHKILILLQGNLNYIIEGRTYMPVPGDVLLVPAGEIHRPVLTGDSLYERVIVYLRPSLFRKYMETEQTDLSGIFSGTAGNAGFGADTGNTDSGLVSGFGANGAEPGNTEGGPASGSRAPSPFPLQTRAQPYLLRFSGQDASALFEIAGKLSAAAREKDEFASGLLQNVCLLELLIFLNRSIIRSSTASVPALSTHPVIAQVITYINAHLAEETLSVDTIADAVFLGRSYLMHLFKAQTGYTLVRYITEKRLFLARSYIASGIPVTDACYQSGFGSYSAFYYAYKNKYHTAPTGKETGTATFLKE